MRPVSGSELTRRRLLALGGAGALGALGLAQAVRTIDAAAQSVIPAGPGLSPDDPAVRETIAALADTVVPGPAGGADPAAGAVEAGAVDELYSPLYGLSGTFPVVHHDAQVAAKRIVGPTATFDLRLSYADRERVLAERMQPAGQGGGNPLATAYAAVAIVTWFAYYGTARSDVGVRYIGFPPHSDGYAPGHSHRVAFRGMTADGNPR